MTTWLGMRVSAIIATASVGLGCGAGAVSQDTYAERRRQVDKDNQALRAKALDELRAKGYVVLSEGRFVVELSADERARCGSARRGGDQALSPQATMTVRWSDPMSTPISAVSRVNNFGEDVVVPAETACAFFAGDPVILRREGPDRERANVVRVPTDGAAAIDPQGQLVLVTFRPRSAKTEEVRGGASCAAPPSPATTATTPTTLEEDVPVPVVPVTAEPARIDLAIDETSLEVSCPPSP